MVDETSAQIGQRMDMETWRRAISLVKVYDLDQQTIEGVTCAIYRDKSDAAMGDKMRGIKDGVSRVVQAGFAFPNGITFYTSSVGGFQNVAFHRDLALGGGTGRKTVVLLGATSADPDPNKMLGRVGVAHAVAGRNVPAFCAAVVVHELGHNLHESLSEDFFWSKDARQPPNVLLAMDVSQYAATNKLEVVAEVFTGMMYKKIYRPEIMDMYSLYGGFYPPALPGGGRRRNK